MDLRSIIFRNATEPNNIVRIAVAAIALVALLVGCSLADTSACAQSDRDTQAYASAFFAKIMDRELAAAAEREEAAEEGEADAEEEQAEGENDEGEDAEAEEGAEDEGESES